MKETLEKTATEEQLFIEEVISHIEDGVPRHQLIGVLSQQLMHIKDKPAKPFPITDQEILLESMKDNVCTSYQQRLGFQRGAKFVRELNNK